MTEARSKILGKGINDATYSVYQYQQIGGVRKVVWQCPYYRTWKGILERVYCLKYQAKEPSYKGTTLCSDWHYFSNFSTWMKKQTWEGLEIDKDILSGPNKIYSPETCVFIPKALNQFLIDRANDRGNELLGVSKIDHKYVARCSDPFTGKRVYLGYFVDEQAAHQAWKNYKLMLACKWAEILDKDGYPKIIGEKLILKYKE